MAMGPLAEFLMQGSRSTTPEQAELERRMREIQEQALAAETEMRRTVLAHAWLLCSCSPYYDRGHPGTPAQSGCVVHASVMVTPDGQVL